MTRTIGHKAVGKAPRRRGGFTLIEVVTALMILALMSSSVLLVVKRCMMEAVDSQLKIQALEVTREKMEALLASTSVKEGTEFGQSEKYPQITWQTTVENFVEPIAQRMWVKVTCGAEYVDANDVTQQLELEHWITSVTKDQLRQILENEKAMADAGLGPDGLPTGDPSDPTGSGDPLSTTDPSGSREPGGAGKPSGADSGQGGSDGGGPGGPLDGGSENLDYEGMSIQEIIEMLQRQGYLL